MIKLYGYWRSSATYRVRIALALKKLEYEYEAVNLLSGEQKMLAYQTQNAQQLVPTIEVENGELITQSLSIIEYLEEQFPERSLLPENPVLRAKARAIANAIACEAQPFMNLRTQHYLKEHHNFDDAAMKTWLNRWVGGTMAAIETQLALNSGQFSIGDQPTIADIFVIPQWFAATRFGVDVSALKTFKKIFDNCSAHPAFEKAHPKNQPDAVV